MSSLSYEFFVCSPFSIIASSLLTSFDPFSFAFSDFSFSFSFSSSALGSSGSGVGGALPSASNSCAKILTLLNVAVKFNGGGPLGVGEGAPLINKI